MGTYTKSVDASNFERDVLESERPVLVDFYADWCGPCQMVKPVLEQLAEEYAGRVDVGKVDVDDNQALASDYGVRSIPTLVLFRDGKAQETIVGVRSKAQLAELLDRAA